MNYILCAVLIVMLTLIFIFSDLQRKQEALALECKSKGGIPVSIDRQYAVLCYREDGTLMYTKDVSEK